MANRRYGNASPRKNETSRKQDPQPIISPPKRNARSSVNTNKISPPELITKKRRLIRRSIPDLPQDTSTNRNSSLNRPSTNVKSGKIKLNDTGGDSEMNTSVENEKKTNLKNLKSKIILGNINKKMSEIIKPQEEKNEKVTSEHSGSDKQEDFPSMEDFIVLESVNSDSEIDADDNCDKDSLSPDCTSNFDKKLEVDNNQSGVGNRRNSNVDLSKNKSNKSVGKDQGKKPEENSKRSEKKENDTMLGKENPIDRRSNKEKTNDTRSNREKTNYTMSNREKTNNTRSNREKTNDTRSNKEKTDKSFGSDEQEDFPSMEDFIVIESVNSDSEIDADDHCDQDSVLSLDCTSNFSENLEINENEYADGQRSNSDIDLSQNKSEESINDDNKDQTKKPHENSKQLKKKEKPRDTMPFKEKPNDTASYNEKPKDTMSGKEKPNDTISEKDKQNDTISEKEKENDTISDNEKTNGTISDKEKPNDTISDKERPNDTASNKEKKPNLHLPCKNMQAVFYKELILENIGEDFDLDSLHPKSQYIGNVMLCDFEEEFNGEPIMDIDIAKNIDYTIIGQKINCPKVPINPKVNRFRNTIDTNKFLKKGLDFNLAEFKNDTLSNNSLTDDTLIKIKEIEPTTYYLDCNVRKNCSNNLESLPHIKRFHEKSEIYRGKRDTIHPFDYYQWINYSNLEYTEDQNRIKKRMPYSSVIMNKRIKLDEENEGVKDQPIIELGRNFVTNPEPASSGQTNTEITILILMASNVANQMSDSELFIKLYHNKYCIGFQRQPVEKTALFVYTFHREVREIMMKHNNSSYYDEVMTVRRSFNDENCIKTQSTQKECKSGLYRDLLRDLKNLLFIKRDAQFEFPNDIEEEFYSEFYNKFSNLRGTNPDLFTKYWDYEVNARCQIEFLYKKEVLLCFMKMNDPRQDLEYFDEHLHTDYGVPLVNLLFYIKESIRDFPDIYKGFQYLCQSMVDLMTRYEDPYYLFMTQENIEILTNARRIIFQKTNPSYFLQTSKHYCIRMENLIKFYLLTAFLHLFGKADSISLYEVFSSPSLITLEGLDLILRNQLQIGSDLQEKHITLLLSAIQFKADKSSTDIILNPEAIKRFDKSVLQKNNVLNKSMLSN